jgi:hypothetical protein
MIKLIVCSAVAAAASLAASAQTFSQRTIDIGLLPDLMPGHNGCLSRDALTTHACEPLAALLRAIVPPPAEDRAVVSATAVLQLC